jgi:hypothetical protein
MSVYGTRHVKCLQSTFDEFDEITYNRLHQCSHHPCHVDMMLYQVRRTLRLSLRRRRAGCTEEFLRAKGACRATYDKKLYSHNGIRLRDGDGERLIRSVDCGVKAVRPRDAMGMRRNATLALSRSGRGTPKSQSANISTK